MRGALALGIALAMAGVACGDGGPRLPEGVELTPLTEEQVRELSRRETRQFLQLAVAAQMRLFVEEGRFTEDPRELDLGEELTIAPSVEPGDGPATITAEVCDDATVVVLGTTSSHDETFAVKARGLPPHEDGDAVFSHYVDEIPPCDPTDGPDEWPGGWFVSREGLQGPTEEGGS